MPPILCMDLAKQFHYLWQWRALVLKTKRSLATIARQPHGQAVRIRWTYWLPAQHTTASIGTGQSNQPHIPMSIKPFRLDAQLSPTTTWAKATVPNLLDWL